jgi:hypothetical protein
MKHAELRSLDHEHPHHPHHVSALAFNVCLVVLALASAVAFLLIARDHLYAYAYSPAGARAISLRIERLNADLIPLEFDRQQQWDNLVASELMQRDVAAARGLVLSARSMLSPQDIADLNRRAPPGSDDARTEAAALDLLTPGTRARYESTVPLLSRRGNSGAAFGVVSDPGALLGAQQDFETIARAIIADPDSEPMQLIITGFHLGLGGGITPRMTEGAAVLMAASRREDYPQQFGAQIRNLIDQSLNIDAFRSTAMAQAQGDAAGSFSISAPAFGAAINRAHAEEAKAVLDKIGAMSQAASRAGAIALLTHAQSLRDVPRLLLIAQAGRDRAAAAAELLPRDGAILTTARGDLTITRDLALAMAVAALALIGALISAAVVIARIVRHFIARMHQDEYSGELVDLGSSSGIRGL